MAPYTNYSRVLPFWNDKPFKPRIGVNNESVEHSKTYQGAKKVDPLPEVEKKARNNLDTDASKENDKQVEVMFEAEFDDLLPNNKSVKETPSAVMKEEEDRGRKRNPEEMTISDENAFEEDYKDLSYYSYDNYYHLPDTSPEYDGPSSAVVIPVTVGGTDTLVEIPRRKEIQYQGDIFSKSQLVLV